MAKNHLQCGYVRTWRIICIIPRTEFVHALLLASEGLRLVFEDKLKWKITQTIDEPGCERNGLAFLNTLKMMRARRRTSNATVGTNGNMAKALSFIALVPKERHRSHSEE